MTRHENVYFRNCVTAQKAQIVRWIMVIETSLIFTKSNENRYTVQYLCQTSKPVQCQFENVVIA